MKAKTIKQVIYVLIIIVGILLAGHLEYKQIQEDIQAQADCRVSDTEY